MDQDYGVVVDQVQAVAVHWGGGWWESAWVKSNLFSRIFGAIIGGFVLFKIGSDNWSPEFSRISPQDHQPCLRWTANALKWETEQQTEELSWVGHCYCKRRDKIGNVFLGMDSPFSPTTWPLSNSKEINTWWPLSNWYRWLKRADAESLYFVRACWSKEGRISPMWKSTAEVSLSQLPAATLYPIEPIKTFPKHCNVKKAFHRTTIHPVNL